MPWEYSELSVVWANPSMTAEELSRLLPGRTPKAVSRVRERYGRWRTEGFTPPCQRCGEHPVWERAHARRPRQRVPPAQVQAQAQALTSPAA